jgi:hypothetical protein
MRTETQFRDMSDRQRTAWIKWCFRHDWCVTAGQNGCREFFVETTDGEEVKFTTPRELRDWAGY